jgi:hypothetical protein
MDRARGDREDGNEEPSGLVVTVEVASPLVHDVDLVAVGVVAPRGHDESLEGSVRELDRVLGGAIEQMRLGGGAGVRLGETLLIDGTPGVRARRVLLIGLGPAETLRSDAFAVAGRIAVQLGLDLASTMGFAPGVRDAGVTHLAVDDIAEAVVLGAREGFAARNVGPKRRLVFSLETSATNRDRALEGIGRRAADMLLSP